MSNADLSDRIYAHVTLTTEYEIEIPVEVVPDVVLADKDGDVWGPVEQYVHAEPYEIERSWVRKDIKAIEVTEVEIVPPDMQGDWDFNEDDDEATS